MGRALQMGSGKKTTYGYNVLRLANDSLYMYEKVLGKEPVERFRAKQGYSEELGKLPVQPYMPEPDFEKVGAKLIKADTASIFTGVAVNGDMLYYGNSVGWLHAMNAKTGKVKWSQRFANSIYSTPIYADGIVVVGGADCTVRAFKASNGRELWSIPTKTPVIGDGIVENGVFYSGFLVLYQSFKRASHILHHFFNSAICRIVFTLSSLASPMKQHVFTTMISACISSSTIW